MNQVKLVGDIGDKFGHEWSMNVSDFGEIIRLIECQTEGFKEYLIQSEENEIGFVIERGKDYINDESELLLSLNEEDIIITAVPLGAGKGGFLGSGFGKIIAGAILIVIGYYMPAIAKSMGWGTSIVGPGGGAFMASAWTVKATAVLQTIGTSLLTQGVTQLLMGTPNENESEDGYLFGAGTGSVAQGQPVPLAYGEVLVTGTPASVVFTTTKPNLSQFTYADRNSNSMYAASMYSSVAATVGTVSFLDEMEDILSEL
jgi:predicted phage tail protein